ncbi:MAG TPA: hypothetical protein VFS44_07580 [Gemmatimonadaceae bacterium]|nr:hypothetical protein [Gemmatimonadaceae bacterium]
MRSSIAPTPPTRRACTLAIILALLVPVFGSAAQSATASAGSSGQSAAADPGADAFHFSPAARTALQQLWNTSIDAKQERVACIGGRAENGRVDITTIEPIAAPRADSANISAKTSLRECAPPHWFGTVHTHIAKFAGQPYIIFSAPDRLVMDMWRQRWHQDGVFCILFSETEANCEAGYRLSGHAMYSYTRGNKLPF